MPPKKRKTKKRRKAPPKVKGAGRRPSIEPTKHPQSADLFTPVTPEVLELLEKMKTYYGTWRVVCLTTEVRPRVLRKIRLGQRAAVSMRLMDKIVTKGGFGALDDFTWFTVGDLIRMGLWEDWYNMERRRVEGA